MSEPTLTDRADAADVALASGRLSTAESVRGDVDSTVAVRRPGVPLLRRGWRQLTSMSTALVLLFLLALAAVPGSLLPQRTALNPAPVSSYYAEHPSLAPILDRMGLFDVYSSLWFYTIYGLLAVSLVGCLTPRLRLHRRRCAPGRRRRRATCPACRSARRSPSTRRPPRWRPPPTGCYAAAAGAPIGVRRTRARRSRRRRATSGRAATCCSTSRCSGSSQPSPTARSTATAVSSRSSRAAASPTPHRSTTSCRPAGQRLSADDLVPFTIALDDFRASYFDNGQPTDFHALVRWAPRVGEPERTRDIRVNHPLAVGGAKVYLMGHGFAPRFVVKDKAGKVVYDDYRIFLPQEGTNEVGVGVLKVPNGVRPQVGMEAAIFPTLTIDRTEGFFYSSSPEPKRPGLSYRIYQGDLRLGVSAQNDFSLDKRGLLPVKDGTLLPGETVTLDNGTTVTFAELREYAVFQTTRDPGARPALVASVCALAGLVASLFVRRRASGCARRRPPGVPSYPSVASPGTTPTASDRSSTTSPPTCAGRSARRPTDRPIHRSSTGPRSSSARRPGPRRAQRQPAVRRDALLRRGDARVRRRVRVRPARATHRDRAAAHRGRLGRHPAGRRRIRGAVGPPYRRAELGGRRRPRVGRRHRARLGPARRLGRHPRALGRPGAVGQHVRVLLGAGAGRRVDVPLPADPPADPLPRRAGDAARRRSARHRVDRALRARQAADPGAQLVLAEDPHVGGGAVVGIFMFAFAATVLYLVKDRFERRTGGSSRGALGHLPAAAAIDRVAYRTTAFAFPIWTFAVIAGAIWAGEAWGKYWQWDPKETWAFITWVVYAGYLHARATAGWKGRRAAIVGVVGFVALMFCYYGVNIWIPGLHSYADI
jgi:cytochrome c biogenesis protein